MSFANKFGGSIIPSLVERRSGDFSMPDLTDKQSRLYNRADD
ncbi:hypothetical protein [Candidatus Chlorohelix sp.]